MNTTANVKALHTLRQNPSFTTRKTTHLNPKRKTPKTVEYLPMVLLPPPQAESVLKYAIPLNGSGRVGKSEDSAREMIHICSKIDQYTMDLENIYGKKKGEVPEDSSHVGRQFSTFLSTCDSAATELDTTINVEHKILESLFEGYQKEIQLLEQLGKNVIPAYSDIPPSQYGVSALISRLMEILKKLEGMKHLFQYLPKIHPQGHILSSPPVSAEEKRGAQIFGPDLQSGWEDHKEDSDSVVKALQGLMTDTDTGSKEVLEKIIHDVGQLFDAQAIELQKLGKDHEETENKYIKIKANYQALLQEKSMLEMELKKLLTWQASQKSSPRVSPRLEERLEKDMEPVSSTVTASDLNHVSERDIIFSRGSQEDKECSKLSESQDKAEVQEEAAPPAGSPVSTLYKKGKIQEEKNTEISEISYTYLDHGDTYMSTSAEPSDPHVVESEIMKVIPEYQPEKKMTSKKVDADRFPKRSVVNTEGNRYHITGHSVSKASGPDQEGSFKDFSEHGRSTKEYKRLQPSPAAVTTNPPTHPKIPKPHPDDMDDTRSRFLLSEKIPDKADEETAQSGNQLEPSVMSHLHFPFYVQTGKYQLPPLDHSRQQQFDEDAAPVLIRRSPRTFGVADLINWMNTHYPLLGKNIKLQTKSLKFHSPRTPIQRYQVRTVQADEFPLYDTTFSQSFSTGLYIQGRHISFTRSLPTEISSRIPSPTHPRQRAERTPHLEKVNRNIPMEYPILPTMTVKGIGRG